MTKNEKHITLLNQGVAFWNQWRKENPGIQLDLEQADLSMADLYMANLSGVKLIGANLKESNLYKANLSGANLSGANLSGADLYMADLYMADLYGANLSEADLSMADLSRTNLKEANLYKANLSGANLREADLSQVTLTRSSLVETNLEGANLTDCFVYGISTWNLRLEQANQLNLIVTRQDEPTIMVDNLDFAQLVYLILNSPGIRNLVDTINTKSVLILGRFTSERRAIVDAIRDEIRRRSYLPILFDLDKISNPNWMDTIATLAQMVQFIIADLTELSISKEELETIVPSSAIPIQVLEADRYQSLDDLIASIEEKLIAPAEEGVKRMEERRQSYIRLDFTGS
jgi:uncharacterized protein YjbI with pentapeptide repeats